MSAELEHVTRLERELLTPTTRADRERLDELLHPEFVEIGASGQRWTHDEMIAALLASPDPGDVEIHGLVAGVVVAGAVLVTYTVRRSVGDVHRCSLWVLHDGDWVVRFHQGTPAPVSE